MHGLSIVPADPVHAPVLSELHALCFADLPETPWSQTAFRTVLKMPGALALLAIEDDGPPSGLLVARETGGDQEILTVCVAPDRRRSGIARALFEVLLAQVPSGSRTVLEVAVDNKPAITLYENLGFRPAGRRPDYYPGGAGRTDALILALEPGP